MQMLGNQEVKNNSLLKLNEENNTSYVDCFFSFLSSKLLNNYNFINGLRFLWKLFRY